MICQHMLKYRNSCGLLNVLLDCRRCWPEGGVAFSSCRKSLLPLRDKKKYSGDQICICKYGKTCLVFGRAATLLDGCCQLLCCTKKISTLNRSITLSAWSSAGVNHVDTSNGATLIYISRGSSLLMFPRKLNLHSQYYRHIPNTCWSKGPWISHRYYTRIHIRRNILVPNL